MFEILTQGKDINSKGKAQGKMGGNILKSCRSLG